MKCCMRWRFFSVLALATFVYLLAFSGPLAVIALFLLCYAAMCPSIAVGTGRKVRPLEVNGKLLLSEKGEMEELRRSRYHLVENKDRAYKFTAYRSQDHPCELRRFSGGQRKPATDSWSGQPFLRHFYSPKPTRGFEHH